MGTEEHELDVINQSDTEENSDTGTSAAEPSSAAEPENAQPDSEQQGELSESQGVSDKTAGSDESEGDLATLLESAREEAARNYDRLLRTTADLENHKRRARRELEQSVLQAEDKVVVRLLPVVDNLERAIEHGDGGDEPDAKAKSLLDGVKMVHKQFVGALAEWGIEPFSSVGTLFDPELHEAIQQYPADAPRNTVVTEIQKGYRRKERLVRPAMVVVSSGPPVQTSENETSDADGARHENGLSHEDTDADGESTAQ